MTVNPKKMFLHVILPAEHLIARIIETLERIRINMLRFNVSHQGPFTLKWRESFALFPAALKLDETATTPRDWN
jgi:hypothetical protein